jgi:multiple sugar transport system permease protein
MPLKGVLTWLAALAAVAVVLSFALGPFLWQLITALKPETQLAQLPPLLPHPPTSEHFETVVAAPEFLRAGLNSVLVAAGTVLVALLLGLPAAFALAKLRPRGGSLIVTFLLGLSMFPPIANVAPLYLLFAWMGIRDHLLGLVIAHSAYILPLTVWILTSFIQEIPEDLFRAARVDGCDNWGILRHLVLPLTTPGLASAGLLAFVFSWNEFLYAFTLTASSRARTLPVAISLFPGYHVVPWGDIAAAAVLVTVPTVALALVFQKRIVSGLTAGAVKS